MNKHQIKEVRNYRRIEGILTSKLPHLGHAPCIKCDDKTIYECQEKGTECISFLRWADSDKLYTSKSKRVVNLIEWRHKKI